jgi:hypothetical protein
MEIWRERDREKIDIAGEMDITIVVERRDTYR